jgi:hypothetical protein
MDPFARWAVEDWDVVHRYFFCLIGGFVLGRAIHMTVDLLGWWPGG